MVVLERDDRLFWAFMYPPENTRLTCRGMVTRVTHCQLSSVRVLPVFGVESNSNRTLRTESYDSTGPVGVDPRWEVFGPFHDYLLYAFGPRVYVVPTRSYHVFIDRFAVTPACP